MAKDDVGTGRMPRATGKGLSAAQRNLAALVATGVSPTAAAAMLGMSERTARAWANLPAFAAEVDVIQADTVARAKRKLRSYCDQACETLGSVMGDATAAPSARVQAASKVLDAVLRLDEAERLTALEAAVRELQEVTRR